MRDHKAQPPSATIPTWHGSSRVWRLLLFFCALGTALPLWTVDYLPFTDLPQHVAAIASFRHWSDAAWRVREHFTLEPSHPQYLLYYLAGATLAFPLQTAERANLVLLSLTAVALPYSLRSLLRAMRGDERLALFACPFFWSQALLIGFFNYLSAMPLLLWALSLAVQQAREPSTSRAVVLGTVSLALFYLHLSAFLFFAPACALAFWLEPDRTAPPDAALREIARQLAALPGRGLWALPTALAGLHFLWRSPVVHPEEVGWQSSMAPIFEAPGTALRHLPDALLDIWKGPQDEWCLLALLGAAALLAWPRAYETEPLERTRCRSLAALWLSLAALYYFAFPRSIGWLWQLNERYALVFALLAPLLLRPAHGLRGAVSLLIVAATVLFAAGTASVRCRDFEREVGRFDRVLDQAAPGKHLLGMIVDQESRAANFYPFLHFASYYRARKGGVSSFSFAELPQSPLRYRPGMGPPAKAPGWEWRALDYSNAREGPYYDYVLVRGEADPWTRIPTEEGPRWRLKIREGLWTLYERE